MIPWNNHTSSVKSFIPSWILLAIEVHHVFLCCSSSFQMVYMSPIFPFIIYLLSLLFISKYGLTFW